MAVGTPTAGANVWQRCETSTFLTLEAFVEAIARHTIFDLGYSRVTVNAYKPSVFAAAEGPGVEVVRTTKSYETT
jgi:dihydroneopterin aldolase